MPALTFAAVVLKQLMLKWPPFEVFRWCLMCFLLFYLNIYGAHWKLCGLDLLEKHLHGSAAPGQRRVTGLLEQRLEPDT